MHLTASPFFSLQANCHSPSCPFAGLTFESDHMSESPEDAVATANVHKHATGTVMLNLDVSLGDGSHGGAGGTLMTHVNLSDLDAIRHNPQCLGRSK